MSDEQEYPNGLTVGVLRNRLLALDDHLPVLVSMGSDQAIVESCVFPDAGLVLFPDDRRVVAVSREWYDAEMRKQGKV
jgi:hypothetical protein